MDHTGSERRQISEQLLIHSALWNIHRNRKWACRSQWQTCSQITVGLGYFNMSYTQVSFIFTEIAGIFLCSHGPLCICAVILALLYLYSHCSHMQKHNCHAWNCLILSFRCSGCPTYDPMHWNDFWEFCRDYRLWGNCSYPVWSCGRGSLLWHWDSLAYWPTSAGSGSCSTLLNNITALKH